MEVKKTLVFSEEEVQLHGGRDGDSFGNWWWVPSHGLPTIQPGKKLVVLHPCDCGCWSKDSTKRAMDLIRDNPAFVLHNYDDRYIVIEERGARWLLVDR